MNSEARRWYNSLSGSRTHVTSASAAHCMIGVMGVANALHADCVLPDGENTRRPDVYSSARALGCIVLQHVLGDQFCLGTAPKEKDTACRIGFWAWLCKIIDKSQPEEWQRHQRRETRAKSHRQRNVTDRPDQRFACATNRAGI